MKQEYGLFIGRFQPFHNGHKTVVDHILQDGKRPIFALGCTQENRNLERNPLSSDQREEMIRLIYPDLPLLSRGGVPLFIHTRDYPVQSQTVEGALEYGPWFDQFRNGIFSDFPELHRHCTLYYGAKEVDARHFTLDGIDMGISHYAACFGTLGISLLDLYKCPLDATNIREEPILGLPKVPIEARAGFLNGLMDALDKTNPEIER